MDNLTMDDMVDMACKIYHDPITKKDLEGIAYLVEPIKFDLYDDNDLSIWIVNFPDDGHYQRTIDKKDLIIE